MVGRAAPGACLKVLQEAAPRDFERSAFGLGSYGRRGWPLVMEIEIIEVPQQNFRHRLSYVGWTTYCERQDCLSI